MALVFFRHLRQLKYCTPRVKIWCKEHSIPLRAFREGIDSEKLRATGCPLATKAAELAESEVAK